MSPNTIQFRRLFQRYIKYWMIFPVAFGLQSLLLLRTWLKSSPPPINGVSVMFQYGGWLTTQGAIPYYHFLEINPPLVYITTSILSFISLGETHTLHVLSVIIMFGSVIVISYTISSIVYINSKSHIAGFISGLSVYTFPAFYNSPMNGFRPATIGITVGLLGLYFVFKNKYVIAGIFAAASAGYWQLAIVFPGLVLFLTLTHNRGELKRTLLGMVCITLISVLPFIIFGVFDDVLLSVVYMPLAMGDEIALASNKPIQMRPFFFFWNLGYASLIVVIGLVYSIKRFSNLNQRWFTIGVGWLLIQVFILVYENWTDLQIIFVFAIIGFGYFVAHRSNQQQKIALVMVIIIIGLNVIWVGGITTINVDGTSVPPTKSDVAQKLNSIDDGGGSGGPSDRLSSSRSVYWNEELPQSCQDPDFVYQNAPINASGCGDYPLSDG